eukprot:Gb_34571 [translate_table: standard]
MGGNITAHSSPSKTLDKIRTGALLRKDTSNLVNGIPGAYTSLSIEKLVSLGSGYEVLFSPEAIEEPLDFSPGVGVSRVEVAGIDFVGVSDQGLESSNLGENPDREVLGSTGLHDEVECLHSAGMAPLLGYGLTFNLLSKGWIGFIFKDEGDVNKILKGLQLELRSDHSFRAIGDTLGKFILSDDSYKDSTTRSIAKILVEINYGHVLKDYGKIFSRQVWKKKEGVAYDGEGQRQEVGGGGASGWGHLYISLITGSGHHEETKRDRAMDSTFVYFSPSHLQQVDVLWRTRTFSPGKSTLRPSDLPESSIDGLVFPVNHTPFGNCTRLKTDLDSYPREEGECPMTFEGEEDSGKLSDDSTAAYDTLVLGGLGTDALKEGVLTRVGRKSNLKHAQEKAVKEVLQGLRGLGQEIGPQKDDRIGKSRGMCTEVFCKGLDLAFTLLNDRLADFFLDKFESIGWVDVEPIEEEWRGTGCGWTPTDAQSTFRSILKLALGTSACAQFSHSLRRVKEKGVAWAGERFRARDGLLKEVELRLEELCRGTLEGIFSLEEKTCIIKLEGEDLLRVIEEVRLTRKVPGNFNSTFIALIPNIDCPENFDGFRPISLCNWRLIHEAIRTTQEGLHTIKNSHAPVTVIKLDLSKAYDKDGKEKYSQCFQPMESHDFSLSCDWSVPGLEGGQWYTDKIASPLDTTLWRHGWLTAHSLGLGSYSKGGILVVDQTLEGVEGLGTSLGVLGSMEERDIGCKHSRVTFAQVMALLKVYKRPAQVQKKRVVGELQVDRIKSWGFFDGACLGLGQTCSLRFVLQLSESHIIKAKANLGCGTNNVGELKALFFLLKITLDHGIRYLQVFGDSALIIS